MSVKIGNLNIDSFKVGSASCKVYLGDTCVYSGDTPPVFEGKWLATYTGGTTSSAECDSTSAITQGEISPTDLLDVQIGDCVTSINSLALRYGSSLTSVTISDSVTRIDNQAFGNCTSLLSVTIGNSVTNIGMLVFNNCSSLTSITCLATTPPTLGSMPFYNTNDCPIYVPAGSVDTYKAASGWSTYADRIQPIT